MNDKLLLELIKYILLFMSGVNFYGCIKTFEIKRLRKNDEFIIWLINFIAYMSMFLLYIYMDFK